MKVALLALCLAAAGSYAQRSDIDLPEEALGCSEGFTSIAGNCYRFYQEAESWSDAQGFCSLAGAKLASVLNVDEYNGLLTHINNNFPGTYWTSGSVVNRQWIWTATGDPMAGQWWGRNPGNSPGQCAYFCSNTLKYWNKDCSRSLRFICQKPEEFLIRRPVAQ